MPGRMLTLFKLCEERTTELLKQWYWSTNFPYGYNPFSYMPSFIVDALIVSVTRKSSSIPLESADLKLLLISGQVREFVLEDVNVNSETLQEILMDLTSACENLTKIKIRNVFCNIVHRTNLHMKRFTLNSLLSKALKVKYVESCLEFDLVSLCHSTCLEKLVLNFPVQNHLFDMFEVNGQLVQNSSLKYLEVFEDPRNPVSHFDIAVVMKYCTELIEINLDICKSLEYLHLEELFNGSLSDIYKIQKCCLGNINLKDAIATRDGVYIASLSCPDIRDISLLVNDDQAVYALSEFHNLTTLLIQWEKMQFGDYTFGVQLLLETQHIGHNLTSLDILNFTNVDFAAIGECCPNLVTLRVEYEREINQKEFLSSSFQKLIHLNLDNADDNDCEESTLIGILCNATDLKSLSLTYAGRLTDRVLKNILAKNTLSKVKDLHIDRCVLSISGVRTLVSSLTALEYFDFGETDLSLDEVATVIHDTNPRVIVSSTFEES